MLEVRELCLHYKQSQILFDVSLSVERGAISCVMGTNGVGKTSLLKAISGVHHRSSGTYIFDGREIQNQPPHVLADLGVAYVPQGRMIFPLLTVRENLETGFNCLSKNNRVVPDEIFELFPILKDMEDRRGGDLSGGQQQRLAIARAVIARPKLLLADEPTGNLDSVTGGEVLDFLRGAVDDLGQTLVVVTHDVGAAAMADRVLFLADGRIVDEMTDPDADRILDRIKAIGG